MAKEKEGQPLKEYSNRKKRYLRRRMFYIISVLLIIGVAGTLYLIRLYNRSYQSYEVMNVVQNIGGDANGYLEYDGNVVRYSKDGAVAIDKNGDLLWNGSYQMTDPIADVCEKYVAVADRGNKLIHIYNEKGEAGSFSTLYDIIKIEVARQGVVAVLMEGGVNNYIYLYNKAGELLIDGKVTEVSDEGYPMDITLSEDGKKMAISYLKVNGGVLTNTVAFFNFGEVGQSYVDGGVGGYPFEDVVIPRVTFLNNDTVFLYMENGIKIIAMKEKPEIIMEEEFEGEIKSIAYSKKYAGLVLEGAEGPGKRLLLYDTEGNKVLDKPFDFAYEKLIISGEEIIFYDKLSSRVLKLNGRVKFTYTFDSDIDAFLPANHKDRYYLINQDEISTIQLLE